MKIAIYPNFGSNHIPDFIRKQLSDRSYIQNRIEMVSILENLEPTHDEINQEIYNQYSSKEPNELNFFDYIKDSKNSNIVFVKDFTDKLNWVYMIEIVEVDTTKVWKIGNYDGSESINYFKEPTIINKELNLGEW